MIDRILSPQLRKSPKSILLLGPRQTGKSTLIKSLKPDLSINFADESVFLDHAQDFSLLRSLIERKKHRTIFIDEVQRMPAILNTVQALVDENSGLKFYLTGSSARKLKRGGANLLPGRVLNYSMGSLILKELNYETSNEDLKYGFLPGIYSEKNITLKKEILNSYSASYVNEEIKSEALVKNLPSFTRFLNASTQLVGQFIDYSKFSQRIKISRHQVPRYFEIFEDTMIGFRILPQADLVEKYDLIRHPKFYFFDVGVFNGLEKTYDLSPSRCGLLLEQLIYQQLIHSASALRKNLEVHSFRTRGGAEIDFWIQLESKKIGIEVKSSEKIIDHDVRHLVHFKKAEPQAEFYLFHNGTKEIKIKGIWCLPIGLGFKEIGL
jgi:predicted AAA+ superfamily ATPase